MNSPLYPERKPAYPSFVFIGTFDGVIDMWLWPTSPHGLDGRCLDNSEWGLVHFTGPYPWAADCWAFYPHKLKRFRVMHQPLPPDPVPEARLIELACTAPMLYRLLAE